MSLKFKDCPDCDSSDVGFLNVKTSDTDVIIGYAVVCHKCGARTHTLFKAIHAHEAWELRALKPKTHSSKET